jgi:hypothetical protein
MRHIASDTYERHLSRLHLRGGGRVRLEGARAMRRTYRGIGPGRQTPDANDDRVDRGIRSTRAIRAA